MKLAGRIVHPRVSAALPAIGLAHATKTMCALLALEPLGLVLGSSVHQRTPREPAQLIAEVMHVLPAWAISVTLVTLVYLFMAPLLSQLVLGAMLAPGALGPQLRSAARRYARALGLNLFGLAATAALLASAYVVAALLPRLVPPNAALEESLRVASLLFAVLAWTWLGSSLDLAAARLATGPHSIARALAWGVHRASPAVCGVHAACFVLASLMHVAGDVLGRFSPWPALAMAILQSFAVAAALARAHWLARTTDLAIQP